MARKTIKYEVTIGERDAGKVFVITEMPASQAQRWALRAFLALARNGVELPPDIESLGMAGMLNYGIELVAKLPFEEADYLLEKLMECVQIMPSPGVVRGLIEDDIEDITTRFLLAKEAFRLHVDFSKLANNSRQGPGALASTTAKSSP